MSEISKVIPEAVNLNQAIREMTVEEAVRKPMKVVPSKQLSSSPGEAGKKKAP